VWLPPVANERPRDSISEVVAFLRHQTTRLPIGPNGKPAASHEHTHPTPCERDTKHGTCNAEAHRMDMRLISRSQGFDSYQAYQID
jgi:hypothetical protein